MLMGDLLEEFFARPYVAAKVAEGRLPDTWREVVGDAVANLTTDLRLENRILYVRLQSSVVRQELFYQREALRDRINEVSKVRLVNAVIVKYGGMRPQRKRSGACTCRSRPLFVRPDFDPSGERSVRRGLLRTPDSASAEVRPASCKTASIGKTERPHCEVRPFCL